MLAFGSADGERRPGAEKDAERQAWAQEGGPSVYINVDVVVTADTAGVVMAS